MAAPVMKFATLFEFGDVGWSEEWWSSVTTYSQLATIARNYAVMRNGQTAEGVNVIGSRLTDTSVPRSGYVETYPDIVSTGAISTAAANMSEGWLVRLRSAGNTMKRNFYLRGGRSPQIVTPVVNDNFTPSPLAVAAKDQLVAFCVANSVGVRTAGGLNTPGNSKVKVQSLAVSTQGYLNIAGTGIGALVVDPTLPIIVSGLKGPAATFNRTYGGQEYVRVDADTIQIQRSASTAQVLPVYAFGGYVRRPTYNFAVLTQGQLEYYADKNTGRAFFVPRGRRRGSH